MPVAVKVHHGSVVDGPDGVAANIGGASRRAGGHVQLGIVGRGVTGEVGGVVARYPAEDLPLIVDVVIDAIGEVVIVVVLNEALLEVVNAR